MRQAGFTFVRQTYDDFGVMDAGICVTFGVATVDHVVPAWAGGSNTALNLVAACARCNKDRGHIHAPDKVESNATGLLDWLARRREPGLRHGRRAFDTHDDR